MITPLDIENKKFAKQMMNGYSVEEVDDFLDQLTVEYEKIYKESSENKRKIDELEKSVAHYKTIEGTLQNTLIMAQSAADEVKSLAKQQADQIVKDAEGSARKSLDELNQTITIRNKELEDMEKQFDVYKAKMLYNSQIIAFTIIETQAADTKQQILLYNESKIKKHSLVIYDMKNYEIIGKITMKEFVEINDFLITKYFIIIMIENKNKALYTLIISPVLTFENKIKLLFLKKNIAKIENA